jgi:hypothetical protein
MSILGYAAFMHEIILSSGLDWWARPASRRLVRAPSYAPDWYGHTAAAMPQPKGKARGGAVECVCPAQSLTD